MKILKQFIEKEKLSDFQIINLIARIDIYLTKSENKHNFKFHKSSNIYIDELLEGDHLNKPTEDKIRQWQNDKLNLIEYLNISENLIISRINKFK
jgi:hypothetical protein